MLVLGNDKPSSGSCSVTPDQGNKVTQTFTVLCKEFSDSMDVEFWNNNLLLYDYSLIDANRGVTVISAKSKDPSISFSVAKAGNFTIGARIYDSLGNANMKHIALTVLDQVVTLDDLQAIADEEVENAVSTGDTGVVARTVSLIGQAQGETTRRVEVSLTSSSLVSLDTSAQELIASEGAAKLILQSLSDLIHTPATNADLLDSDIALSISILERAVEGMQLLSVPTISIDSGDLIVSLLDDLVKAAVASSSATRIDIQRSSEKVRKAMGQLTALGLSVGQTRLYGSGCIAIMYMKVDQATQSRRTAASYTVSPGTCSTFTIPHASLPAAANTNQMLIEVGGVSPYITSPPGTPLGNFMSTQMFSVTFYDSQSNVASSNGLTDLNQIVIAHHVSDARNCLGVSMVTDTVTWSTANVQCSTSGVNDDAPNPVAATIELMASGAGTFAAVVPPVAPTAAPTAAPTTNPTTADDTVTTLVYSMSGFTTEDFDPSTTKGQSMRTSAVNALIESASGIEAGQVTIGDVTAADRRTGSGVHISFVITGSGNLDLTAVNAAMTDAGANGFVQAFIRIAESYGYTVAVFVTTLVSTSTSTGSNNDSGSTSYLGFSLWVLIVGVAVIALLLVAAAVGITMYLNHKEASLEDTAKKKGDADDVSKEAYDMHMGVEPFVPDPEAPVVMTENDWSDNDDGTDTETISPDDPGLLRVSYDGQIQMQSPDDIDVQITADAWSDDEASEHEEAVSPADVESARLHFSAEAVRVTPGVEVNSVGGMNASPIVLPTVRDPKKKRRTAPG
jgi:hypothetical protein